jgi:hypothetical protein
MSWNHRVVRHKIEENSILVNSGPNDEKPVEYWYGIHEAYYLTGDVSGRPSITTNAIEPYGESPEELRKDLERMLRAFDKPVLDFDTRDEVI